MREPRPSKGGGALSERLNQADASDVDPESLSVRGCGCGKPRGFGAVATVAYALITVVNAGFGGLCFLLWGDKTESNVLKNLPDGAGAVTIRLLLTVDLLFTIPMILAAGREVRAPSGLPDRLSSLSLGHFLRLHSQPCPRLLPHLTFADR